MYVNKHVNQSCFRAPLGSALLSLFSCKIKYYFFQPIALTIYYLHLPSTSFFYFFHALMYLNELDIIIVLSYDHG